MFAACQRLISGIRNQCEAAFPQLQNVDQQVRPGHRGGAGTACGAIPVAARVAGQPPPPPPTRCPCPSSGGSKPARTLTPRGWPPPHRLQALKQQLLSLRRNMQLMALVVLPLAKVSSESLTAVYARTFEKAAFGFAKVSGGSF
jgi:hypothetical protein